MEKQWLGLLNSDSHNFSTTIHEHVSGRFTFDICHLSMPIERRRETENERWNNVNQQYTVYLVILQHGYAGKCLSLVAIICHFLPPCMCVCASITNETKLCFIGMYQHINYQIRLFSDLWMLCLFYTNCKGKHKAFAY